MDFRRAGLLGILVTVALALEIQNAAAGSFFFPGQCQIVSTDPPRYRLTFLLSDHRYFGPLCEVRLDPVSRNGSLVHPVLAGSAPSALQFATDPSGSAHFTAAPCVPEPWYFYDSLSVIVDGVPAYFDASLISTGGVLAHVDIAEYPCSTPVGVGPQDPPPQVWLGALSPNPASVGTSVRFGLPREARVRITIHDVVGRRCRTLVDARLPAGVHGATWDLRDGEGHDVPAGLYLARLDVGGRVLTRRLIRTR